MKCYKFSTHQFLCVYEGLQPFNASIPRITVNLRLEVIGLVYFNLNIIVIDFNGVRFLQTWHDR